MDWETAWREEAENHPRKLTEENRERWTAFWNQVSPSYLQDIVRREDYYREMVDFLVRESFLQGGDRVLDVGCGPGTFALPLAEHAGEVVALDSARGMLDRLMEEASRRSLENITPLHRDWDSPLEGEFDLVISSLSPAIRAPEDLFRMESLSSRACVLITRAGKGRVSQFDRDMWEEVLGGFRQSGAFEVRYPFNVLYDRGKHPNLRLYPFEFQRESTVERAWEEQLHYCSIFTEMDGGKREALRRVIDRHQEDGVLRRISSGALGMLYWRV
ncbi:MAG: class I SAM-dependent methyltransferase [Methanomassiliicoccales archaeon]